MRNAIAIFFILASIGIYFLFTDKMFAQINQKQAQITKYDQALDSAEKLAEQKQSLKDQVAGLPSEDVVRLNKILPDNADNVRLIIDINNIAEMYGLSLKNIAISDKDGQEIEENYSDDLGGDSDLASAQYGIITISFGVTSTYDNFVNFLKALEKSIRLNDVVKLSIDSSSTENNNIYDFSLTLKTYWIK